MGYQYSSGSVPFGRRSNSFAGPKFDERSIAYHGGGGGGSGASSTNSHHHHHHSHSTGGAISSHSDNNGPCPIAFHYIGGRCYFYGYFKLNWFRAMEFCHSFGQSVSLACIENPEENKELKTWLTKNGRRKISAFLLVAKISIRGFDFFLCIIVKRRAIVMR